MEAITHHHYFSDIEATFIRCRGKSLFLSPRDWALMEQWEKMEIPLHIVNTAIEDVCKTKQPTTLAYCQPAVERSFEIWLDSQVGKCDFADIEVECMTCHDSKEVTRIKEGTLYQCELIPCPDCKK
jgi:hypothetical protein